MLPGRERSSAFTTSIARTVSSTDCPGLNRMWRAAPAGASTGSAAASLAGGAGRGVAISPSRSSGTRPRGSAPDGALLRGAKRRVPPVFFAKCAAIPSGVSACASSHGRTDSQMIDHVSPRSSGRPATRSGSPSTHASRVASQVFGKATTSILPVKSSMVRIPIAAPAFVTSVRTFVTIAPSVTRSSLAGESSEKSPTKAETCGARSGASEFIGWSER